MLADCCGLHCGAGEVGAALGVLVGGGLPALALLLSGDGAAALFSSDPAVLEACRALKAPLATLLISE